MRFKGNLERIEKFDADLGPEGSMGKKIKLLVKQYLYQTSPVGALENTIQTVNDEARHIINNLLQGLEVLNEHIGKFRDELDTDITKAIKNWNELKLHDPESMSLTINDIHLKISALIKLINFCMKSKYSTMLRSSTDGDTAAEPAHNEQ
ncbi:MAG: hypothetical protein B0D92_05250 [Spirochaeta sp. LUC14_002_19_P3]|nr:MAG: hypothetical protein B0D92_05250 [Spirochaeta sp. LUC14_002_19_P3]